MGYINQIISTIMVGLGDSIGELVLNLVLCKKKYKEVINIFENMFRRKRMN